ARPHERSGAPGWTVEAGGRKTAKPGLFDGHDHDRIGGEDGGLAVEVATLPVKQVAVFHEATGLEDVGNVLRGQMDLHLDDAADLRSDDGLVVDRRRFAHREDEDLAHALGLDL